MFTGSNPVVSAKQSIKARTHLVLRNRGPGTGRLTKLKESTNPKGAGIALGILERVPEDKNRIENCWNSSNRSNS